MERTYGPIENLRVIPNSIEGQAMIKPKRPFVLGAGRWWDEGKNGVRLDAAAQNSHWLIMMAGSRTGPNGERFDIKHARGLNEMASADLRELMCQASIFVAPSLYEPFGLAPMEAARARCALVLSDIPTFHEIWDDAAIFVDPLNEDGISAAINRLARSSALLEEMAERAQRRSLGFTPERHARLLLGAYSQALSGTYRRMSSVA
jgi:glycosyltransferase involved in cell wall biosynthesis